MFISEVTEKVNWNFILLLFLSLAWAIYLYIYLYSPSVRVWAASHCPCWPSSPSPARGTWPANSHTLILKPFKQRGSGFFSLFGSTGWSVPCPVKKVRLTGFRGRYIQILCIGFLGSALLQLTSYCTVPKIIRISGWKLSLSRLEQMERYIYSVSGF